MSRSVRTRWPSNVNALAATSTPSTTPATSARYATDVATALPSGFTRPSTATTIPMRRSAALAATPLIETVAPAIETVWPLTTIAPGAVAVMIPDESTRASPVPTMPPLANWVPPPPHPASPAAASASVT